MIATFLGILLFLGTSEAQSFLRCYRMARRFTGGLDGISKCSYYVEERQLNWHGSSKWSLSNIYQEIDSYKLFGSEGYPRNVKCVWRFKLRRNHNAFIGCSYLNLDDRDNDCDIGHCHPKISYGSGRDFLRIHIKSECSHRSSEHVCKNVYGHCRECQSPSVYKSFACSHLSGDSGQENLAFCGKARKSVGVKVRSCQLRKGRLDVEFWSDESRRGRGFKCYLVDLSENKHIARGELEILNEGILECNETNNETICELLRKLRNNSVAIPSMADEINDLFDEPTTATPIRTTKLPTSKETNTTISPTSEEMSTRSSPESSISSPPPMPVSEVGNKGSENKETEPPTEDLPETRDD